MTDQTGTIFAAEPMTEALIAEASGLCRAHMAEAGALPEAGLAIDVDSYLAAAEAGVLRVFTARRAGVLVGYSVHFLRHHPHQSHVLCALQDALYLAPGVRQGSDGMRLVRYADELLGAEGVDLSIRQAVSARDCGGLLVRLGYRPTEVVYTRRLAREPQGG